MPTLRYISDLITIDCLEDGISQINMAYSHPTCPVCNTEIQDSIKEECDRCGWLLKINNLLEPKIYDSLLNWSIKYYDRAKELESRGKYRQDILNNRLNTQRDDIDLLKQQIEKIVIHIPEIQSILLSQDIKIVRDINSPIDNSELDSSLMETEESGEPADIERQLILELPTEPNPESENTLPDREDIKSEVVELSQLQQQIISDYYYSPKEFAFKYQVRIANITKNSINANRSSEDKLVILEENNRGNYWIFDFDDRTYLVPVEDKYINQHSYTTTSTIFEGHNYTPDYQKIQLIKPAIVSIEPNTNPQTWRLQEQGELVFL